MTSKRLRNLCTIDSVVIDSAHITPSDTVRNLGAVFDNTMNSEPFVNSKCKGALHALRNISRVRRSLTADATKTLIQAYVISRLDYCNSLLYGIPASLMQRLQRVQNYAARVTAMAPKRDHVTPVLYKLHWLPIHQRVDFKMMLYVYKSQNGLAPAYLRDLLHAYTPSRKLRSADKSFLHQPHYRTKSYGGRAFAVAAPKMWNELPLEVRLSDSLDIFKKKLKTYLFCKHYN